MQHTQGLLEALLFPVLLASLAGAQIVEVDELKGADSKKDDQFGHSVSLWGDRLVAGAPYEEHVGYDDGAAYVIERQPDGAWTQVAKLVATGPSHYFGFDVSLAGDRALIGSPGDLGLGLGYFYELGAAYVFERGAGGVWTEVAKLTSTSTGPFVGDFGSSVSLSGDRAIVGDPYNPALGSNAGSAHVFERDASGTWAETAVLHASDAGPNSTFGYDVAIDGDRALVSAWWAGKAYLFERQPGGAWTETAQLVQPGGGFSGPISLQGDRALVASWGAVDVFERQVGGAWTSVAVLAPLDPTSHFGNACALDGDRAVVGDNWNDAKGPNSGAAYLFERQPSGAWVQTAKLIAGGGGGGDWFGTSVAIHDDRAVAGAVFDHTPRVKSGSAILYDLLPLSSSTSAISLIAGGSQALSIDAGKYDHGGELYLVLGSTSGTAPGVPVGGGFVLPLNQDAYFLFTLTHVNSVIAGSFGQLSAAGSADASLNVPAGTDPSLAGLTVHHAFVALDPLGLSATLASNALAVDLVP